jgi:chemotaxis protein methyltransferase CheR
MSHELLSQQVFIILTTLIEGRIGLHYGEEELPIFSSKLLDRMEEAGFGSPLDYYYHLRYDDQDGQEFAKLASALFVGETYFYREARPLEIAIDFVVQRAVASSGRARVLSAACSTGEEPLTLAMMLAERDLLDRTEIVAIDANDAALEKARAGVYGGRSFRALPESAARWFTSEGATRSVDRKIHDRVQFVRANLVAPGALEGLGTFDLVLCRNVLIYFRDAVVVKVVQSLSKVLRPNGRLLVGASESLMRFGTRWRCEERGGVFLYERVS